MNVSNTISATTATIAATIPRCAVFHNVVIWRAVLQHMKSVYAYVYSCTAYMWMNCWDRTLLDDLAFRQACYLHRGLIKDWRGASEKSFTLHRYCSWCFNVRYHWFLLPPSCRRNFVSLIISWSICKCFSFFHCSFVDCVFFLCLNPLLFPVHHPCQLVAKTENLSFC